MSTFDICFSYSYTSAQEHQIFTILVSTLHKVIGPSGVRALPLAAGINVGGHYKWHFFLFLLSLSLSGLIANSPRRDCRRVLKFCMGS